jgi:hypothetical protein
VDVNVRALDGARCGAPSPGRVRFCKRELDLTVRTTKAGGVR